KGSEIIVLPLEGVELAIVVVEVLVGRSHVVLQPDSGMVAEVQAESSAERIAEGGLVLVIAVVEDVLVVHERRADGGIDAGIEPELGLRRTDQRKEQDDWEKFTHARCDFEGPKIGIISCPGASFPRRGN